MKLFGTPRIVRCATKARSAIAQPSKVPRLWIRIKRRRRLPSVSCARPHAGASRQTERTVVIGDGAPWIWNIAQELFPRAIQIVDRFHVKQTLSTVAKAIYAADSPRAHQWARRRHDELDAGKFPDLLGAVRRHADTCEEAENAFNICIAIATVCAIPTSKRSACALPAASWKRGAQWQSVPASSVLGCIGPSVVPTPSSRSGAPASAGVFKTSGSVGRTRRKRRDPTSSHFLVVRPENDHLALVPGARQFGASWPLSMRASLRTGEDFGRSNSPVASIATGSVAFMDGGVLMGF